MSTALISAQTRVESPFIIAKIGSYTFGKFDKKTTTQKQYSKISVTYPNFMEALNITKINGAVNTYTLRMVYGITQNDDPNMLEKVFSSVSKSRKITLQYGDWSIPTYIYKEEEALITKVTSNVDFSNSKISYTINCVSTSISFKAGVHDFKARKAKPSDVIKDLVKQRNWGITDVLTGMKNLDSSKLSQLIVGDDQVVNIEAKSCNVFDYIAYLVSCMVCVTDTDPSLKKTNYYWAVYDDTTNDFGGSYFKVIHVTAGTKNKISYNTYEVDVGYPSGSYITAFNIKTNDTWSILYDYGQEIQQPQYQYTIDKDGNLQDIYSPSVTTSKNYGRTTEANRTWWSKMTQFPISASIEIKGLLRPVLLMSYLKVNTYFYGRKHISSGLYIITKQEDSISSAGYKTTLSLTRISGDDEYV